VGIINPLPQGRQGKQGEGKESKAEALRGNPAAFPVTASIGISGFACWSAFVAASISRF
jgi:hypothetical protein